MKTRLLHRQILYVKDCSAYEFFNPIINELGRFSNTATKKTQTYISDHITGKWHTEGNFYARAV
jgi:hypothetical protein